MAGIIPSKDFFLLDQIEKFKDANPTLNLGFAAITGSDTYGFRSSDSDYDIRGVFYYDVKEIIKLFNNKKSNFNYTVENKDDIISNGMVENNGKLYGVPRFEFRKYDFVFTEVNNFLSHINRMNCTTLEQLFSPMLIYCTPHFEKLKKIVGSNLAKKGIYDSYKGMATFNYKHYIESGQKLTAKKWLYVIRAYLSGIYALDNHKIEQNINILLNHTRLPDSNITTIKKLIEMKLQGKENSEVGEYDSIKDTLLQIREYLHEDIHTAYNNSLLPEQPIEILREYLDYWIVDLRNA